MYRSIRQHGRLAKDDVLINLEELCSIGATRRPSDLPRYPRDAMQQDLNQIGRDMYKAIEGFSVEPAPTEKRACSSKQAD